MTRRVLGAVGRRKGNRLELRVGRVMALRKLQQLNERQESPSPPSLRIVRDQ